MDIKLNNAILYDAILKKFNDNQSYDWPTIHSEKFYKSLHNNHDVVVSALNFLMYEGWLERHPKESDNQFIRVTEKGNGLIGLIDSSGYVAQYNNKKAESLKHGFEVWIPVIIIVGITLYTYLNPTEKSIEIKASQQSTIKKSQTPCVVSDSCCIHQKRDSAIKASQLVH